ncbi:MAG: DUF3429 domain-containing protein [Devosia sp.]
MKNPIKSGPLASIPLAPLVLGVAGVLPFALATIALWVGPQSWQSTAATAVTAYGFVILAFLGGVHWGRALSSGSKVQFVWSVLPSLAAFFAAFLARPSALAVLAVAFIAAGIYDIIAFGRAGPQWYATLRIWLTILVTPLLALSAVALAGSAG